MGGLESTQAMLDNIDRQLENQLTEHFNKMAARRAAEQRKQQIAVIYLIIWAIGVGLIYTVQHNFSLPMLIVSFVGVVALITYRVLTMKQPDPSKYLTGVKHEYGSMVNRFWSSAGYGRYNRSPSGALKRHVMMRDGGRCRYCSSSHNLEFDHIRPWSKGGATTASNMQLLCRPCNRRKSNKW